MDRSNEFSIYHSQSVKYLLHILYWVMMFFFTIFITSYSFKAGFFDAGPVLFCCCTLFNAILVHYFVCHFLFQHIKKKRWALIILDILAIYLLSLLITTPSLNLLRHLYPENTVIARLHHNFAVNSFRKPFDGE